MKMKQFDHPNVLTLFGVCVDAGPAPYIVMPYMAKGSLLSYLRKERHNVILTEQDDSDDVSYHQRVHGKLNVRNLVERSRYSPEANMSIMPRV